MGRWKYSFSAIDPTNVSATWEIGVSHERYRHICNHGHEKAHARIVLIGDVVESTVALYGGWNREGMQDCYVYVGQPREDYHKLSPIISVPPPPGMVFLVFVLPDGTIDEWNWRPHADGDINTPLGVEGKLIWRRDQS